MSYSRPSDPAERSALMRLFYRDWRPTRLGRWVNQFACWWSCVGLPPRFQAALEARRRAAVRFRGDCGALSSVPDRSRMKRVATTAVLWRLLEDGNKRQFGVPPKLAYIQRVLAWCECRHFGSLK